MSRAKMTALTYVVAALGLARTASADGAVYAMTNALGDNQIQVYYRASDGTLTWTQTISTGGGGSGVQLDPTDSLGSQGGLVLDKHHRYLFAVNTESLAEDFRADPTDLGDCEEGTISAFRVADDGKLTLVSRVPSGGLFPASLAVHADDLFVLNAGGPGSTPDCGMGPNVTGFRLHKGRLERSAHAARPIDPGTSPGSFLSCDPGGGPFPTDEFRCGLNPPAFPRGPAQIGFSPDGNELVATVKGTNSIYVFPVKGNGKLGSPKVHKAAGPNQPTYFGFAFDKKGHLIVTEPFGATPTIPAAPFSATSSFRIKKGVLEAISPSVPSGRGTACWVTLDPDKRYAYVGNNATSDISTYGIAADGSLTLLAAVGATAHLPNDLAVARDHHLRFLYVLNSGNGTVGAFRINGDGSLTALGDFMGLPVDAGAQGLAAY